MLIFFWFWYFLTLILIWLCFDFWILNISKDWIFMIMLILFLNSSQFIIWFLLYIFWFILLMMDFLLFLFIWFFLWNVGQRPIILFLFRLNILLNMLLIWLHPLEHDLTYYYYFFYIYFSIEQNLDFLFMIELILFN